MSETPFPISPRDMSQNDFMACFGGVYEHSPWIAERLLRQGLDTGHDTVAGLAEALAAIVDASDADKRLALINAHPDLAGQAAIAGELTADSNAEQASAGIDLCTPEEFRRFESLNAAYQRKFGFTFVMAVKGSNRHKILAAFEQRLQHEPAVEFEQAICEIHKIARLRLEAFAAQTGESNA